MPQSNASIFMFCFFSIKIIVLHVSSSFF
jgi:hypothetical protein